MKPLDIKYKYGFFIALLVLLYALIEFIDKGFNFYEKLLPREDLPSLKIFILIVIISAAIVWFAMNHLWKKEHEEHHQLLKKEHEEHHQLLKKEHEEHQQTRFERDNYFDQLKISENKRLTDVITGVPNLQSLENDIENHFSQIKSEKKFQFILIDLKGFKKINDKYGFLKTNELLRAIAQTIYQKMRRNEDMYKYPMNAGEHKDEHFYRMHTGGDEFVFIIEGNQPDALGFVNRLVKNDFEKLTKMTEQILGENVKLSFHCALVEMDPRDKVEDILRKSDECYRLTKEGKEDFTICWHPINIEQNLKKPGEVGIYKNTRDLFEVLTIEEKDYS